MVENILWAVVIIAAYKFLKCFVLSFMSFIDTRNFIKDLIKITRGYEKYYNRVTLSHRSSKYFLVPDYRGNIKYYPVKKKYDEICDVIQSHDLCNTIVSRLRDVRSKYLIKTITVVLQYDVDKGNYYHRINLTLGRFGSPVIINLYKA